MKDYFAAAAAGFLLTGTLAGALGFVALTLAGNLLAAQHAAELKADKS